MKAEYGELKGGYGEIRLFPESIDDLWHLRHLIHEGDLVFATTFRSVDAASDKIRPEKVEKRPVRLGVRIGRVEFSEHGVRLRLTGIIEHGVDGWLAPFGDDTRIKRFRTCAHQSHPILRRLACGA